MLEVPRLSLLVTLCKNKLRRARVTFVYLIQPKNYATSTGFWRCIGIQPLLLPVRTSTKTKRSCDSDWDLASSHKAPRRVIHLGLGLCRPRGSRSPRPWCEFVRMTFTAGGHSSRAAAGVPLEKTERPDVACRLRPCFLPRDTWRGETVLKEGQKFRKRQAATTLELGPPHSEDAPSVNTYRSPRRPQACCGKKLGGGTFLSWKSSLLHQLSRRLISKLRMFHSEDQVW